MRREMIRGCVVIVLALVACAVIAARAAADPPYLPWVSLLPTTIAPYDPTSDNPCRKGSSNCVDRTVDEMTRQFDSLASACSHEAIFALTYLRVTQAYAQTVEANPTFFVETPFVNNEDAVFAGQYFSAYDDWYDGRRDQVPPAWQLAFRAADSEEVSGTGDLLLGINAHVNRDLPFVLADLGLFAADGSSRKPDHDRVNIILNSVEGPILAELQRRFDPSIFAPNDPTGLTETSFYQLLESWREEAWRNAERLAEAQTPAEWAQVAQSIEQAAALEAQAIIDSSAYHPPVTTTAGRDAYCAAHWQDSSAG